MVQYRICKYSFYDKKEYCVEQKAWFTFWRWKPVRNLEGDIITDTKERIKYLIYCWTEKPQITPITETKE